MKHFRTYVSAVLCAVILFVLPAQTRAGDLEDAGLDLGIHSVHYPRYTDPEAETAEAVNSALQDSLHITDLTGRLAAVMSNAHPLTVTWDGEAADAWVSAHIHASGPVESTNTTVMDFVCNLDLRNQGEIRRISLHDIFENPSDAIRQMETKIDEEILPYLSAHLPACDLLPMGDVAENFTMDTCGITFYYPADRFTTLSGSTGNIRFYWWELEGLKDEDGSLPAGMQSVDDAAQSIASAVSEGALPGIPAHLGDPMPDILGRFPMLHDPDNIEGARIFEVEGAAFRDVLLLTDALSVNDYENSLLEGIRTNRYSLYGLETGRTTVQEWRELLGRPDATVELDADKAEMQGVSPGTSDYYAFGEHTLRLHADRDQILTVITLQ